MIRRITLVFVLMSALSSTNLLAHGGLSMDDDKCILVVGSYSMHFTGYQPKETLTVEFCEDIPTTGDTIVVLDFLHKDLKSLPIEFRIVRAEAFDSGGNIEGDTVMLLPTRIYPSGVITAKHNFSAVGDFIGLVTVDGEQEYTSKFPFSVGRAEPLPKIIYLLAGIIIIAIAIYMGFGRNYGLKTNDSDIT